MKKVITISVIAVAVIVLMVVRLKANQKDVKSKIFINDPNAEVLIETGKLEMHTFEGTLSYLGTFEAYRQNVIGSDASGSILKVLVKEGDYVQKGELLAKVDDELLQLQLQSAEIGLEGVKNDDSRYSTLSKENAIAGVQVEKTKLNLRANQVQKKLIQKQIKNTSITAPYSGVITQKMIDLGSFVGQGTPVFQLTDISTLKLNINVPESDVFKFKTGSKVSILVDAYKGKVFTGKIINVGVVADRSHNFKIQVEVPNAKRELRAGMYGTVTLDNSESKTVLSIPRSALVGSTKNPQVYVVENKVAKLKSFTRGTADGDYIQVVNGLSKDDIIVVKGQVNLEDGSKVTFKK
ncbi:MAG TPA: efflux RND transporter periplasmic adaptor subunit [Fluviicola sp.]|nr:efflux RND transporter periplasmic adaptor subunit [Fluviicola sp.]